MTMLLKDLLTKHQKNISHHCQEDLIANGYIYSPVFGWERMEIIEQFGLKPDLEGVPAVLRPETDYKEVMVSDRDENGKPTGEKKVIRKWFETGKKVWGAADNYLAYLQFKKDRWAKYDAEEYAKKINTPQIADEYYNN